MITDQALLQALLIVMAGVAVGWLATVTGLGAGLSLPMLAACGVGLPVALLTVKLPVAAADAAAWIAERRHQRWRVSPRPWQGLPPRPGGPATGLAALGGMAGATLVLLWSEAGAATQAAFAGLVLASCAVGLRRLLCMPGWQCLRPQALVWGSYVGCCGIGAAWLWRLSAPRASHAHAAVRPAEAGSAAQTIDSGLGWRCAANLGAVLALLLVGQIVEPVMLLLAAAQCAGAWLAARSGARLNASRLTEGCGGGRSSMPGSCASSKVCGETRWWAKMPMPEGRRTG